MGGDEMTAKSKSTPTPDRSFRYAPPSLIGLLQHQRWDTTDPVSSRVSVGPSWLRPLILGPRCEPTNRSADNLEREITGGDRD